MQRKSANFGKDLSKTREAFGHGRGIQRVVSSGGITPCSVERRVPPLNSVRQSPTLTTNTGSLSRLKDGRSTSAHSFALAIVD